MSLRDLADRATPGPWRVDYGRDEPELTLWADGHCIAQNSFHYGSTADYEVASLAPELAVLAADMAETLEPLAGRPDYLTDKINALLSRFRDLDGRASAE